MPAGLVDQALERAGGRRRVRQALGMPSDRRISNEVIDELLAGASTEEELAGPGELLAELTKRLVERAMEVELTDHVGYEPHQEPPAAETLSPARRSDPSRPARPPCSPARQETASRAPHTAPPSTAPARARPRATAGTPRSAPPTA
ncbi:MAG: hypothetical protein ACYDHH_23855 [Solirubrobacteraceae bacterium]